MQVLLGSEAEAVPNVHSTLDHGESVESLLIVCFPRCSRSYRQGNVSQHSLNYSRISREFTEATEEFLLLENPLKTKLTLNACRWHVDSFEHL